MSKAITVRTGGLRGVRVRAVLIGCVRPCVLRAIIEPDSRHIDGGTHVDLDASEIPRHLRMPNTSLWLTYDCNHNLVAVAERAPNRREVTQPDDFGRSED